VLGMFWMMHHMFVQLLLRVPDRMLMLINSLYLCFLSLVPFSARVLAAHLWLSGAVVLYGANVLAIGLCSVWMQSYVTRRPHLAHAGLPEDLLRRGRNRNLMVPALTALGMLLTPVWIPLALALYAFPVFFNLVPGLYGAFERVLGMGPEKKEADQAKTAAAK
jgi:uncharacterized membrane protein